MILVIISFLVYIYLFFIYSLIFSVILLSIMYFSFPLILTQPFFPFNPSLILFSFSVLICLSFYPSTILPLLRLSFPSLFNLSIHSSISLPSNLSLPHSSLLSLLSFQVLHLLPSLLPPLHPPLPSYCSISSRLLFSPPSSSASFSSTSC